MCQSSGKTIQATKTGSIHNNTAHIKSSKPECSPVSVGSLRCQSYPIFDLNIRIKVSTQTGHYTSSRSTVRYETMPDRLGRVPGCYMN